MEYANDEFENVIYTDESSIQLETHRRFCCRKRVEAIRPMPRYKKDRNKVVARLHLEQEYTNFFRNIKKLVILLDN